LDRSSGKILKDIREMASANEKKGWFERDVKLAEKIL
jgi:hypothetical protein